MSAGVSYVRFLDKLGMTMWVLGMTMWMLGMTMWVLGMTFCMIVMAR